MDTDIRKTRTCEHCKAVVPLDKVKLYPKDSEHNMIVCGECCEQLKNKLKIYSNEPPRKEKKVTNNVYIDRKEERIESGRNLVKKYCIRCKYSFRVDPERAGVLYNLACPYCGKDDKVIDKQV